MKKSGTSLSVAERFNIGPTTGDIASPNDGDIWYNATTGKFRKKQNSIIEDLDTGGSNINFYRKVASHTLELADINNVVEMDVATSNDVSVPTNASVPIPIGSQMLVSWYGVGQPTFVPLGGVVIRSYTGLYTISQRYAVACLLKVATDEWYLFGGISQASSGGGETIVNSIAAAGSTQVTATLLTGTTNFVTTATAGSADGVRLPPGVANAVVAIINHSTSILKLYPATGEIVEGGAANDPLSIYPGQYYKAGCTSTGVWDGFHQNVWDDENNSFIFSNHASIPATPPAGTLRMFARNLANRLFLSIVGPSGLDTTLQPGIHGNSILFISPTTGTTAPLCVGGTITTAATMSFQFTAGSTNRWTSTSRKRFQTSTTAGNASGMRTAYVQWFRGSAVGFGGFFFRAQLGAQLNINGGQKFVGLCASTGALAGDPSALLNMCGMGYDAADSNTGNWQFMRNDGAGAATRVDLGANAARGTTQGWDLIMFMAPNSAELFVKIVNLNTGVTVLDTSYTTDLPAANTGMAFKAEVRNGAVAAADNLEVAKVYIESDY